MTPEQCSVELRNLRKSTSSGKRQQEKVALDARAIRASEEDFRSVNLGIVKQLFVDKTHIDKNDIIKLQT